MRLEVMGWTCPGQEGRTFIQEGENDSKGAIHVPACSQPLTKRAKQRQKSQDCLWGQCISTWASLAGLGCGMKHFQNRKTWCSKSGVVTSDSKLRTIGFWGCPESVLQPAGLLGFVWIPWTKSHREAWNVLAVYNVYMNTSWLQHLSCTCLARRSNIFEKIWNASVDCNVHLNPRGATSAMLWLVTACYVCCYDEHQTVRHIKLSNFAEGGHAKTTEGLSSQFPSSLKWDKLLPDDLL